MPVASPVGIQGAFKFSRWDQGKGEHAANPALAIEQNARIIHD